MCTRTGDAVANRGGSKIARYRTQEPTFGVRKLDRTLWCGGLLSLLPRPRNVQIPDAEFCALQENPEKPASVKARETTRGVNAVLSAAAAQPAPGGRRNRLGFMRLIGPGWVTKPGRPRHNPRYLHPGLPLPPSLSNAQEIRRSQKQSVTSRPAAFALAKAAGALYVAALSDSLR
jgi:hypothetical protein